MKRIFAWQTDTASCFLYRLYWPLTNLNKKKFQVSWGAPGADIFDYDIVIGQRICGANDLWREICRNPNIMAIYDLDDDLLHVDPENTVPYSIYGGGVAAETFRNIAMADKVTVSTPILESFFDALVTTVVLPNCLPQSWMNYREPPHPPVIGWMGSMFHKQDFDANAVADALAQIRGAHQVDLHTIGANYISPIAPARTTGWTTLQRAHEILDFSIGLAPLMHSRFNMSKSHCKALEYASKGIPTVASDWGQYQDFIEHGVNGVLVRGTEVWDWTDGILQCLDNLDAMSKAAYMTAQNFAIERNIHLWESVYAS